MVVIGTGFDGELSNPGFVKAYGTLVGGFFINKASISVTAKVQAICAPGTLGRMSSSRNSTESWRSDVAAAVASSTRATTYRNCAALNKVYPHGVGRTGAQDKTSGRPVTNFTRNTGVYNVNTARDRDKDGIACEKR